jgi:hypothetical protein
VAACYAVCDALSNIAKHSVAKHIGNILTKLVLPPAADDNRPVLAIPAFLSA